jgi:hypothetical protein
VSGLREEKEMRVVPIAGLGVLLASAGCAGDIDQTDGEDGPDQTCEAPEYGDGACDLDLACDVPDIDCYVLFDGEPAARAWFMSIEEQIAASELREPRTLLPTSDAHYTRMRALLDEGWAAYREVKPVGDLAAIPPQLVVIEDPSVNAFVQGDGEKAAWSVMVYTGLMDVATDEQLVAIVMHELTHAVRLHVIPERKEAVRIHYLAPEGSEPFGFQQADDAQVHASLGDWRALASDVGPLDAAPLVGFPLSQGNGTLYRTFVTAAKLWGQAHADICAAPLAQFDQLSADIMTYFSTVDQTLHIAGVEESLANAQNNVLVAVRDQCMAGLTDSYITILADLNGKTEEEMRAILPDEDEALVEGKHFVEAIATLINDRRSKMRAIEADFATATGQPWSRVRHYTSEEEADDATLPVLQAMDRAPDGIAPGLALLDSEAARSTCNELLASGTPPYGADLYDDHHANCFRMFHVRDLAASGILTGDGASALRRPAAATPARAPRYRPLPFPTSYEDYRAY